MNIFFIDGLTVRAYTRTIVNVCRNGFKPSQYMGDSADKFANDALQHMNDGNRLAWLTPRQIEILEDSEEA
jgi:hypothetical protein